MARSTRPSPADAGDRHRRLLALALLAFGLRYAFSASTELLGAEAAGILYGLEVTMSLTMAALMAPIAIWKIRMPREEWQLYAGGDGFVEQALQRAQLASWSTTLVLLGFTAAYVERSTTLPARFFLEMILAVMLVVFSITFLLLSRAPADDDLEKIADA